MVSNTAQLSTKSVQVAELRKLEDCKENQNLVFNSARPRRKKKKKRNQN